jgi:hypothetical protein
VAKIIEHVQAYYDVQEVEYGKVYKWRPENILIECGCGELITLTASETTCKECGAEHAGLVREDLTAHHLGDETLRPWRYSRDHKDNLGLPY